jgi:hypothetical protein
MQNDKLRELEERYASWSTEDIVRATTVEKEGYTSEAIELMLRELNRRNISQEEIRTFETEAAKKMQDEAKRLSGVRGFLLLFLIVLIFNSIRFFLWGFSSLANSLNPLNGLSLVLSAIYLIVACYGITVSFLLIRKSEHALTHTKWWIVFTAVVGFVNLMVAFFVKGRVESSDIGNAMFAAIFAVVWLTYISQSRRVANTYGRFNNLQSN